LRNITEKPAETGCGVGEQAEKPTAQLGVGGGKLKDLRETFKRGRTQACLFNNEAK
jgi:hypothetical protein